MLLTIIPQNKPQPGIITGCKLNCIQQSPSKLNLATLLQQNHGSRINIGKSQVQKYMSTDLTSDNVVSLG